jgi:hypothetical protein
MSLSIVERILVPGIGVALFAVMSRGFMAVAGGSTRRMKTVLFCAILFMTAFAYAVFWQDKLAELFAWRSVESCRRLMCRRGSLSLSNTSTTTGKREPFDR